MIIVHRLNGAEFALNAELIETVEENPDTTITMVGRRRFVIAESTDDVIRAVTAYRRQVTGVPIAVPNLDHDA